MNAKYAMSLYHLDTSNTVRENRVTDSRMMDSHRLTSRSHGYDWHVPSLPADQMSQDDNQETESTPHADVMLAEPELAEPPMYAVVMYNDDYTPMEFVVAVLQAEFRHNVDKAVEIMLNIHHNGKGVAGIFPKDIAETKAKNVNSLARREGFPLLTQIEPHQG